MYDDFTRTLKYFVENSHVHQAKLKELKPGLCFNIKMISHQDRKSHFGDKGIINPAHLRKAMSSTGSRHHLHIEMGPSLYPHEKGYTENITSSYWWNFHHSLYRKLSKWNLPVHSVWQWHRHDIIIIIILTTFGAANDESIIKMTAFPFRCM